MIVSFLDLQAPYRELKRELDSAYRRVMESGLYLFGSEVEMFESEFAAYCEAPYCVGVGSGLDALHLILKAYGIGSGDEVLVPSNTYIATWLAVSYSGAKPVPVEPDPVTYNIDPRRIPAAVSDRSRAIIPVHLYGLPADMDPILEIGQGFGLRVIEDAAQAHGARYKGRRTGSLAAAAAFSFYPAKNLGAFADAGAVVTSDHDLAEKVRMLRNYGSKVKYHNEVKGYNSRLDTLNAAFLRVKLNVLDVWNQRRGSVAERYLNELACRSQIILPVIPAWAEPAWHLFIVRHPERSLVQQRLQAAGIQTLIHYPFPPHLSPAYGECGWKRGDFPVAERLAATVLSLPMGPHLDRESIDQTIETLAQCV